MRGLARAGWRLTFNAMPTETFLQDEVEAGVINLDTSLGAQFRSNGAVRSVAWEDPAFRAGLSPGAQVVAINSHPFPRASILEATSVSASAPIILTLHEGGATYEVAIPYAGPLLYPHLERIPNTVDRLTR